MRIIGAAKVKTQFLSILKDVERNREPVLVTRNGKPVAKVVPLDMPEGSDPLDIFYYGKIEILGDLMQSAYTDAEWEEFENASLSQLS